MPADSRVVVIGGANVDIKGRVSAELVSYTSNPGVIEISMGGVARNIAENLARLSVPVSLITAVGEDEYGKKLIDDAKSVGINTDYILTLPDVPSSMYLAIIDEKGDLAIGLSQMDVLDYITPEYLSHCLGNLGHVGMFVLDADIPSLTIEYILEYAQTRKIPVCIEPVSVAKAKKVISLLDRVTLITPNKEEAETLVGVTIKDKASLVEAGERLLTKGVCVALISLGKDGAYLASRDESFFLPSMATKIVDSTGAGDAMVAGMIYGLLNNFPYRQTVIIGLAAAALTLKSEKTVSPKMSFSVIEKFLTENKPIWQKNNHAKQLCF